jgi:hypothetical protein
MLPYHTIEGFLKFTDPGLREIVLELRNIVAQVAPGASEDIRHGGIVYYFEELGGPVSAGVCGVAIKPDHVRLYFTHGAFIPDKTHLLKGSGKAMRYLKLDKFESVPWEEIRDLIAAHADFDPRSFTIT